MSSNLPAWPEGVARHVLAQTDSTMAEAARLAPRIAGPAWILARRQTAAHGRRGRPWVMPEGNFAATLLFRPNAAPQIAALYSFVAALALDDALAQAIGPAGSSGAGRLAIKWPNDVLLNGGKVAGILLETATGAGAAPAALAIGFGVNLAAAPGPAAVEARALHPVSVLGETGLTIAPEDFLTLLAAAFAARAHVFQTFGFAPVRQAWLARAARLGQRITARTGAETLDGVFETIDDQGALMLRGPDGLRAISAAEIFF